MEKLGLLWIWVQESMHPIVTNHQGIWDYHIQDTDVMWRLSEDVRAVHRRPCSRKAVCGGHKAIKLPQNLLALQVIIRRICQAAWTWPGKVVFAHNLARRSGLWVVSLGRHCGDRAQRILETTHSLTIVSRLGTHSPSALSHKKWVRSICAKLDFADFDLLAEIVKLASVVSTNWTSTASPVWFCARPAKAPHVEMSYGRTASQSKIPHSQNDG